MPKHKVDMDVLQKDVSKRDLKRYMCEIPGCRSIAVWLDKKEEWVVTASGKKVNIGEGKGLVYNTCENCGRKICPHPKSKVPK